MNPRTELEMLREELGDNQRAIGDALDEDVRGALWEARMVIVNRIAELEQHMGFRDWERRKLEVEGKYLKSWLARNYGEHPDSEEMLHRYEKICDTWGKLGLESAV